MADLNEETRNVLITSLFLGILIICVSLVSLFFLTRNFYTDAYYTIETFFDAPNTAASFDLAALAFGNASLPQFIGIVGIVILDNLSKIMVISFVIAAVLDIIRFANVEAFLNRMQVKKLNRHIIVCGYNEFAEELARKLVRRGRKVVIIDSNPETPLSVNSYKAMAIVGNFAEHKILENAGVKNASDVVFTSQNDIDNLVGAITVGKMNPKAKLYSRVTNPEVRTKMYRVGVSMCVLPEALAALDIGEAIVRWVKVNKR